ncbi:MAG: hydrogen gas-evolving membrane-bound hydrogenase subunit E [Bacillota bacterium]|nr:hydrogen gas-evolving membrane-bound hydrogenase subunit E [Bacillota bacterium]
MSYILILFLVILAIFLRFVIGVELRSILTIYLLGLIVYLFSFTVAEMPPFGRPDNPAFNEVPARYLEAGPSETGAINIISSVITDYRAFDTLGEATVLFVAIAAAVATLKSHRY